MQAPDSRHLSQYLPQGLRLNFFWLVLVPVSVFSSRISNDVFVLSIENEMK